MMGQPGRSQPNMHPGQPGVQPIPQMIPQYVPIVMNIAMGPESMEVHCPRCQSRIRSHFFQPRSKKLEGFARKMNWPYL
jgi:hypothetical protein